MPRETILVTADTSAARIVMAADFVRATANGFSNMAIFAW
jgi:hypothetical protein